MSILLQGLKMQKVMIIKDKNNKIPLRTAKTKLTAPSIALNSIRSGLATDIAYPTKTTHYKCNARAWPSLSKK